MVINGHPGVPTGLMKTSYRSESSHPTYRQKLLFGSQARSRAPWSFIYGPIIGRKGDVATRETPEGKMKTETVTIVKDQEGAPLRQHGDNNTYQDRPMYLIRAVTVHSNRPKEVWFGPSAYTARILWSGGEIFLLRALGDHLWGHSEALWAPRRAACAERRRQQLPKPLPVSATVCWRSGSLGQGQ